MTRVAFANKILKVLEEMAQQARPCPTVTLVAGIVSSDAPHGIVGTGLAAVIRALHDLQRLGRIHFSERGLLLVADQMLLPNVSNPAVSGASGYKITRRAAHTQGDHHA